MRPLCQSLMVHQQLGPAMARVFVPLQPKYSCFPPFSRLGGVVPWPLDHQGAAPGAGPALQPPHAHPPAGQQVGQVARCRTQAMWSRVLECSTRKARCRNRCPSPGPAHTTACRAAPALSYLRWVSGSMRPEPSSVSIASSAAILPLLTGAQDSLRGSRARLLPWNIFSLGSLDCTLL